MFSTEINSAAWADLEKRFSPLNRATAAKVAARLVAWLGNEARKKPVADLDTRLAEWAARIEKMSKALVFKFDDGKRVAVTAGPEQETLVMLDRGTDWFEGHPDIAREITIAVFSA